MILRSIFFTMTHPAACVVYLVPTSVLCLSLSTKEERAPAGGEKRAGAPHTNTFHLYFDDAVDTAKWIIHFLLRTGVLDPCAVGDEFVLMLAGTE